MSDAAVPPSILAEMMKVVFFNALLHSWRHTQRFLLPGKQEHVCVSFEFLPYVQQRKHWEMIERARFTFNIS